MTAGNASATRARLRDRALERLVVGREVRRACSAGSASGCSRRRAAAGRRCSRQQSQRTTRRDAVVVDRLPAGVVAERTGHRSVQVAVEGDRRADGVSLARDSICATRSRAMQRSPISCVEARRRRGRSGADDSRSLPSRSSASPARRVGLVDQLVLDGGRPGSVASARPSPPTGSLSDTSRRVSANSFGGNEKARVCRTARASSPAGPTRPRR